MENKLTNYNEMRRNTAILIISLVSGIIGIAAMINGFSEVGTDPASQAQLSKFSNTLSEIFSPNTKLP